MTSHKPSIVLRTAASAALIGVTGFFFAACDGSDGGGTTGETTQVARPALLSVEYGRLVDVYAYRRTDQANPDRRDARVRKPVLVKRNVVIDPEIETEELFDAIGGERVDADYRFLPFDARVGHDELLILWDDTDAFEGQRFEAALAAATGSLQQIPASFRNQNTSTRPIPVVPRNAAIKLNFDRPLNLSSNFFDANPGSLQLLQFVNDPDTVSAPQAFAAARYRVLPGEKSLVVDTTLIGGEAVGRVGSTGLAPSADRQTANFRIAIPIAGISSRAFSIEEDRVPELNGIDSIGNRAVIRDFRSGNVQDGRVAVLADITRPQVVGNFAMGITDIDDATNTITLNKRGANVPIRGRIPFVDGAILEVTGLPGGRTTVPTVNANQVATPLSSGDIITQSVVSSTGEVVTLRAEVIENLEVGTRVTSAQFPAPGLTINSTDGGELAVARVRVSSIEAFDSAGNPVKFQADTVNPLGRDCEVQAKYYESISYDPARFTLQSGVPVVSDSSRRNQFLVVDPPPTQASLPTDGAVRFVNPICSVGVRFSEPMDLERIDVLRNLALTTAEVSVDQFTAVLDSPKSASLSMLATRVVDEDDDGTLLKLLPPMGLFHLQGETERYWFHALLDEVRDLSGNKLDLFDRRAPAQVDVTIRDDSGAVTVPVDVPLQSFSVQLELAPSRPDNRVASRVYRFENIDEDGTKNGSVDLFGQFRLIDGRLLAAETTRFSAVADNAQLSSILRIEKGECASGGATAGFPMYIPPQFPAPPGAGAGQGPGFLYQVPSVFNTRQQNFPGVFQPPGPPVNFGGIVEPHVRRGSRMQITYREDDLGLGYHDVTQFNIDVEQLHWAPWNDTPVLFDEFDRYSILLGHSDKRPDMAWFFNDAVGGCDLDCGSLNSGLSTTFADNVLNGSAMKAVVDRAKYVVNPALAFRNNGTKFVPYAQFETTYTWRDSRLVSWDMDQDVAVGLGGAFDATQAPPLGDRTASVSSPWTPDMPDNGITPDTAGFVPGPAGFTRDRGDFRGDRSRDHDPIALPLLIEFRVFPDTSIQSATSANLFWIGHIGSEYTDVPQNFVPNGYYNLSQVYNTAGRIDGVTNEVTHAPCTALPPPSFRVHTSGGIDPVTGLEVLVQPDDQEFAIGGTIVDIGVGAMPYTGIARVPAGDSHIYWGQADFVRRVSLVTAGFFDAYRPNRHDDLDLEPDAPPALPDSLGRPAFSTTQSGITEFDMLLDPPVQQGGATLTVELRGAQTIAGNNPDLYNPQLDDDPESRGNLLNPNYACEAYRYASTTADAFGDAAARVEATGLTPYVTLEQLDSIRDGRGHLPRFLNYRLVMTNNIKSTPTVSASLKNLMFVYRVESLSN